MLEKTDLPAPRSSSDGELSARSSATAPSRGAEQPGVNAAHQAIYALGEALHDTQSRLVKTYAALVKAEDAAARRERFVAVLVHDLRNSLQSIAFGTEHLKLKISDPTSLGVVARIERSNERMSELIQNVLDLVRSQHTGHLPLALLREDGLAAELHHVIAEIRSAHVDRMIDVELNIAAPITCDRHRIAQLLGNLLGNAVTHGATDEPIELRIRGDAASLEIVISNGGAGIPADRMSHLFDAFSHGPDTSLGKGLGLGLYIAAEIAKAHAGTLRVESDRIRTCFTFWMPAERRHDACASFDIG